jgi:hypothetical protein
MDGTEIAHPMIDNDNQALSSRPWCCRRYMPLTEIMSPMKSFVTPSRDLAP